MYGATATKRVYASGWSPTFPEITVRPYRRAARSLAIATTELSPSSATCAAASAVVPAASVRASGIAASSCRHWSRATGWERISRMRSSGIVSRPTRQCRIGRIVSAAIESPEP